MNETEQTREDFKPDRIVTLFVGESAPRSGKFFYRENTNLFRQLRRAFNAESNFLKDFRSEGFYLDDLVLEPVNGLGGREKQEKHEDSIDSLAGRIAAYEPSAIVIIGIGIQCFVRLAACKAGFKGPIYSTAFPGRPAHRERFHRDLENILPKLPRLKKQKEAK